MRAAYDITIRWDITWRTLSDEATRDELTLVICKNYSDVANWNVAF
jgi:hypothetical protein